MAGKYDAFQVLSVITVLALVVTVSILWVMPVSAFANGGKLNGEIDGEPRTWRIVSPQDGRASSATYSVISPPSIIQNSISGYAGSDFSVKHSFSLSFTTMNGALLGSPQVSYFPESKIFPLYSNEGKGRLVIDSDKDMAGKKQLKGRYQGTLVRVEKIGQAPDGNNVMEIDVHFDVLLHEEE